MENRTNDTELTPSDRLREKVITNKWRLGLSIAIAIEFALSIVADIATFCLVWNLHR